MDGQRNVDDLPRRERGAEQRIILFDFLHRGASPDDEELIAAVTVAARQAIRLVEGMADDAQRLIAVAMPVRIVEILEMVDIHHLNENVMPGHMIEIRIERAAVAQAGQGISFRRLLEAHEFVAECRHIGEDSVESRDLSLREDGVCKEQDTADLIKLAEPIVVLLVDLCLRPPTAPVPRRQRRSGSGHHRLADNKPGSTHLQPLHPHERRDRHSSRLPGTYRFLSWLTASIHNCIIQRNSISTHPLINPFPFEKKAQKKRFLSKNMEY